MHDKTKIKRCALYAYTIPDHDGEYNYIKISTVGFFSNDSIRRHFCKQF